MTAAMEHFSIVSGLPDGAPMNNILALSEYKVPQITWHILKICLKLLVYSLVPSVASSLLLQDCLIINTSNQELTMLLLKWTNSVRYFDFICIYDSVSY